MVIFATDGKHSTILVMNIDAVITDIKALKIQGATNVALTLLDTLENVLGENNQISAGELQKIGIQLAYARPTEPLAQNALRYIFSGGSETLIKKIKDYRFLIEQGKHAIATNGVKLFKSGGKYLTLCHSSTTVSLFANAWNSGITFSVYVAETRPLFQGRITASELLKEGINDVTMIIDDVAVSLLNGMLGKIDAVFIGADLLSDHGFVNKVGSLAVAEVADKYRIPVYSVTTLLKFDPRSFDNSIIEIRSSEEIWDDPPNGLKFYAPAFDYVPYKNTVQIVSEVGIINGSAVRQVVENRFPFIVHTK